MSRPSRYLDALLAHLQHAPPEPGTVVHVEVRHDADCPFWDGHPCDCEPIIATGSPIDRKHGGDE